MTGKHIYFLEELKTSLERYAWWFHRGDIAGL